MGLLTLSWNTLNRSVERTIAQDPSFPRSPGRPLRSDAKDLSDEDLLARLRSLGIDLDRPYLERLCDLAISAQELTEKYFEGNSRSKFPGRFDTDWLWICLLALWERWFPDKPCLELLDDKIQNGYDLLRTAGADAACRVWLEAWGDVLRTFDRAGFQSIAEFDQEFNGEQSVSNWIQDLEANLWAASVRDPRFLTDRIALCESVLRRFPAEDDPSSGHWRRALAESWFESGEAGRAEALYGGWLQADPGWGWGWIGWSDCLRFTNTQRKNPERAEQILRGGLAVANVRDRHAIAERLSDLLKEQGRTETELLHRLSPAQLEIARAKAKTGRNDPCPCGSGRKFKKCCGA